MIKNNDPGLGKRVCYDFALLQDSPMVADFKIVPYPCDAMQE
jgi:hypothetical protein